MVRGHCLDDQVPIGLLSLFKVPTKSMEVDNCLPRCLEISDFVCERGQDAFLHLGMMISQR